MRISDLIEQINLITKLVKNDLKSRYSGSAFGMVWAYVQPLVTVLVFWYVFQVGFKNPPVDNIEYILWFIAGYIPWIYFNDSVLASTNVFYEYSYLVMKMKFKVWQLPIIKVLSSLCIHMFFILFILYNNIIVWSFFFRRVFVCVYKRCFSNGRYYFTNWLLADTHILVWQFNEWECIAYFKIQSFVLCH